MQNLLKVEQEPPRQSTKPKFTRRRKVIISATIALISLALAYVPLPGFETNIVLVGGTELAEPLQKLEEIFERQNSQIKLDLKFQGSQDIVNNYIARKNDFKPTIVMPASEQQLLELNQRLQAENQGESFYEAPQPIAKTMLVGIAWSERGKILFPDNRFSWQRIEQAMKAKNWQKIGGQSSWGSFDFLMADPTRSNSGQMTLFLWINAFSKGINDLNNPAVESLVQTIKQSVYLPPRSSDILLQEFIARGANEADVATTYESIALYRWKQSGLNQGNSYKIYYLNPTIESVITAAIMRQDVGQNQAKAAKKFLEFLREPDSQKIFVQYGFRPIISGIDLASVPNNLWEQNIPGVELNPTSQTIPEPDLETVREIQRLWNRSN